MPCEEGPIGFKRVLVLRKIKVRTRSAQYISRCRRLTELVFLFTSLWCQKCKIEGQKCKIEGQKCKIAGHPRKSQRNYGYTKDENEYLNQPSFNQNQREYFEWSILVSPNPFSKPLDSNNKCIALTITVSCPYLLFGVSLIIPARNRFEETTSLFWTVSDVYNKGVFMIGCFPLRHFLSESY